MADECTVSICVPTCNRPALLCAAIRSCMVQTRKPDCIIVGDDSLSDDSERAVLDLSRETGVRIDYRRNLVRLGQNENINSLFDRATTSHLILLHDDDELLPNAVEDLLLCWREHTELTAAFGKQYVMSHDGVVDLPGSVGLNAAYFRTSERAGMQRNDWEVGLLQQFPNDGYMILTSAARLIRWRREDEVGAGGDFDFGFRLGLNCHGFYFLDKFTMKYRLTESDSMSNAASSDTALKSYLVLADFKFSSSLAEAIRSRRMAEMAPRAVMQAVRRRELGLAWRIYWSKAHGWRRRFSLGGARRLLFLLLGFLNP